VKLLLDENLSPAVAHVLAIEDGIDACHVRDRAGLGWEDPEVFERAFKEDRIVVTCNVNDFLELARGSELHAGVILIEQSKGLKRPQLLAALRAAIGFIGEHDMANRVLWVRMDGTMEFEDIPPG
jgi:predicted nuclease of predicted toxin-antitoxin system